LGIIEGLVGIKKEKKPNEPTAEVKEQEKEEPSEDISEQDISE